MRIIFFIFLSSLSLLAQSNHLSDSLLFRGFNKIVCINAPEDPVALNFSDRQIDDINYAIKKGKIYGTADPRRQGLALGN